MDETISAGDLRSLVAQIEARVSDVVVSTGESSALGGALGGAKEERASSAAEAVRAAARAAREGRRASAVLRPDELFDALGAIHAAARERSPITIHVAAGPETAAAPGRDELAPALELGAGVLVSVGAQDAVDLSIAARRAAEDGETPWIVVSDGAPPLSAIAPGAATLADFLGPARGAGSIGEAHPLARKRAERSFASRAPFAIASAMRELGRRTGRPLEAVERYETADADTVVVAVGASFAAARQVAAALRAKGERVGAVGVRALRPFFAVEAVKALARAQAIAVIEPLDVALAPSGPLAESVKAAFADALTWAPGFPGVGKIPPIVSAVFATLDGGVREDDVRAILGELATGDRARRVMVFGSDSDSAGA